MGKSTISMAIFNSYFDITRGYNLWSMDTNQIDGGYPSESPDLMEDEALWAKVHPELWKECSCASCASCASRMWEMLGRWTTDIQQMMGFIGIWPSFSYSFHFFFSKMARFDCHGVVISHSQIWMIWGPAMGYITWSSPVTLAWERCPLCWFHG